MVRDEEYNLESVILFTCGVGKSGGLDGGFNGGSMASEWGGAK